jgi:hypothetical protein
MRELVLVTDKWTEKARGIDAGFMNGEFDVLIAQPLSKVVLMFNANTIFYNNANNYCLICIKCEDVWSK